MLAKYGKGTKKVPLSRCIPPETGSGRINAPHGGRYCMYCQTAIKKANRQSWQRLRRLFQMECTAKMRIIFGLSNKKAELFKVRFYL